MSVPSLYGAWVRTYGLKAIVDSSGCHGNLSPIIYPTPPLWGRGNNILYNRYKNIEGMYSVFSAVSPVIPSSMSTVVHKHEALIYDVCSALRPHTTINQFIVSLHYEFNTIGTEQTNTHLTLIFVFSTYN